MSRSNGRVLLTTLLCVWFYLPCVGQGLPTGTRVLPGSEAVTTKTHDLSSAIAAHVGSSKMPKDQAKSNAIAMLFAVPATSQPQTKRTEIRPGVFEVVAPASFHDYLDGMAKWMANGEKQITIESRILTVSETQLRKLHTQFGGQWEMTKGKAPAMEVADHRLDTFEIDARRLDDPAVLPNFGLFKPEHVNRLALASSASNTQQFLPCRIASIRDPELKRVVEQAQSDTRTNIMQAPKVTLFDGQEAVVTDATQRPFVTSVEPSDDTANAAMQPVITVLEDGISMRIKASVVGEDEVHLDSKVTLGEIGDVDTFTFETPGKFNGTSVQIPEYTTRTVNISKKLLNDQSLIIDPHFVTEKVTKRRFRSDLTTREYTIVILTARVIQQQAEQEGPKVAKL